ncbi:MAG: hypothetical protein DRJ64_02675 [Thermoprotei archaeon]|nr:MAG: hypothetical protein DRJ64_02675 [Thermoprotei archaeon]
MDEILNDKEVSEVQRFLENPVLKQAIEKIVLFGVYSNGTLQKGKEANPMRNFAITINEPDGKSMSDEQVGQILRAKRYAIEMLEEGFGQLETFKKVVEKEKDTTNKAR